MGGVVKPEQRKLTSHYRKGRLQFVEYRDMDEAGKVTALFKCDCGTEKVLRVNNVQHGKTSSCGCFKSENIKATQRKDIRDLAATNVLNRCRRVTPDTDLDADAVRELIFRNCFYCEKSPEEVGTIYIKQLTDDRSVKRIGIDRVDNNKGYYRDNSVPACQGCNYIKRTHGVSELVERLEVFIKNLKTLEEK